MEHNKQYNLEEQIYAEHAKEVKQNQEQVQANAVHAEVQDFKQ